MKNKQNHKELIVILIIVLFLALNFFLPGNITGFASFSIYPEETVTSEDFGIQPIEEITPTKEEDAGFEIQPIEEIELQREKNEITGIGIMALPAIGSVALNSTAPTNNNTLQNLTCYATATDADGNPINYSGFWYKNNIQQFYIWNKTGEGSGAEFAFDMNIDSSNNIILTGNIGSTILTAKYNSSGDHIWNRTIGGLGDDYGKAVTVDSNDDIIVTGYTSSFGAGKSDYWTIKYNSSGSYLWNTSTGGTENEYCYAIIADSNDDIIVTGYTSSFGAGLADVWTIKYNSSGSQLWNKTIGGTLGDDGFGIIVDSNDNIIVAGVTSSFGAGSGDTWTIKYNSSGSQLWNRTIGGINLERGYGITVDSQDNLIVAGYTYSFGAGNSDVWTIKYNSSGSQLWNRTIGGTNYDFGEESAVDSQDNIIITGYTSSFGAGNADVWTIKYNSSGNYLLNRTIGGTNADRSYAVTVDSSDNIIVAGYTQSFGVGSSDFWIIKYYGFSLINQIQGQQVLVDTLDSLYTAKDELWYCSLKAYDGTNYSSYNNSNNILILNSAPSITQIYIYSDDDTKNDSSVNLTMTFSASDVDSGPVVANETRWYNNSIEETGLRNFTSILAGNTTKNDDWMVEARISDGEDWSVWTNSSNFTILNADPIVNLRLPLNNTNSTTQLTEFIYNVTDADGNEISNCTLWIENSTGLIKAEINTSITIDQNITLTLDLSYEKINWSVGCVDNEGSETNTSKWIYTVIAPSSGLGGASSRSSRKIILPELEEEPEEKEEMPIEKEVVPSLISIPEKPEITPTYSKYLVFVLLLGILAAIFLIIKIKQTIFLRRLFKSKKKIIRKILIPKPEIVEIDKEDYIVVNEKKKVLLMFNHLIIGILKDIRREDYHRAHDSYDQLNILYNKLDIDSKKKIALDLLLKEIYSKIEFGMLKQDINKKIKKNELISFREKRIDYERTDFIEKPKKDLLGKDNKKFNEIHRLIEKGKYRKARKLLK